MRIVSWSLAVSAALFISGIAFIIAAARSTPEAAETAPVVQTSPVASIKHIMNGVTGPAANVIYGSVGSVISARGIEETAPKNDEEWAVVANNAAMVAESGNLLMMPGRAIDNGDWMKFAQEMVKQATAALKAAEAQDKDGILTAGGYLNLTCDECHARYQRQ